MGEAVLLSATRRSRHALGQRSLASPDTPYSALVTASHKVINVIELQ